jgi:adenosylcobinamide-GDP ribazoletransferase
MTAVHFLVHELRLFFVALQFLTRVPVPRWVGHQPGWLNDCVRHFPAAGALVGTFGVLVMSAASPWWPPLAVGAMTVSATVWLTGAFHEDGLTDTFDALGGAVPRERALAIMKDSRIGTYGAAALVMTLALRAILVGVLLQRSLVDAALALIASHVVGRGCAVALMGWAPYAGDVEHAKVKPLATKVARRHALTAAGVAATSLVLLAACSPPGGMWRWGAAAAGAAGVVLVMRRWLHRRLGGYTGDTLGATEQLAELVVLLCLAAA